MPIMPILRNHRSLLRTKRLDVEPWPSGVTIRLAGAADAPALRRLAALDEHPPLEGDALVAEVGGELWAAAGIDHAAAIADPFRPAVLLGRRLHIFDEILHRAVPRAAARRSPSSSRRCGPRSRADGRASAAAG